MDGKGKKNMSGANRKVKVFSVSSILLNFSKIDGIVKSREADHLPM